MLDAADSERGVGAVDYECPVRVFAQDSWLLVLKQRHELELGDVHQTFVGEF